MPRIKKPAEFLTKTELGEKLGVSIRTLNRWIDNGSLIPTALPGKLKKFSVKYIDKWLADRTQRKAYYEK